MKNFNEKTFVPNKKTDWYYISEHQKLSERFIEKYSDKVDWYYISEHQKLSERFIEKYSDKVDWNWISISQKLSEEFIEKYSDKVNWSCISTYQKLSEEFIEKYSNKVDWFYISINQKLSEKFIEKHSDKVVWFYISRFQKLSEKFVQKHRLTIPTTCWLYKTKKEKLKYIKENTSYQVIDGQYIVAYKSTRSDGTSVFNRQYHYAVGKEYSSRCDCNIDNENSFGLAAWTKGKALEYHSRGKLFKAKIHIDDIGCFVKDNHKIRCWKLTILKEVKIR